MRVDASQVLAKGGLKIKIGSGNSLRIGDVVQGSVVSSGENGAITLKMESGESFSAKFDGDAKFAKGDTLLLEVVGNDRGTITLTLSGVETTDDELPAMGGNVVGDFDDKNLEPYARKLFELNMPVAEKTATLMKALMAQNSELSLDEAAFLASNKIIDNKMVEATLAMLAGRDNIGELIDKLMTEIKDNSLTNSALGISKHDVASNQQNYSNAPPVGDPSVGQVASNQVKSTPLADFFIELVNNAESSLSGFEKSAIQFTPTSEGIIPQNDSNMQINAENVEYISTVGEKGSVQPNADIAIAVAIQGAESEIALLQKEDESSVSAKVTATNVVDSVVVQTPSDLSTSVNSGVEKNVATPAMTDVVTQLLSDIPEFSDTPRSALEQFSNTLLRIAGDNVQPSGNLTELTEQLEKLFTRISLRDPNSGMRLMNAKAELFARLALLEEAVANASNPARAELLDNTHRLMNQVRVFNSVEQFAYMQLPVQLYDEKKVAELYVFKRKGKKRTDTDDVNILLAIQLQFMGHWEALINIKNRDVSINMEVLGMAEKEHFSENTVLLHQLLEEVGFKLVSTNITFTEVPTTPLTALTTLNKYTGIKQGTVDFKI